MRCRQQSSRPFVGSGNSTPALFAVPRLSGCEYRSEAHSLTQRGLSGDESSGLDFVEDQSSLWLQGRQLLQTASGRMDAESEERISLLRPEAENRVREHMTAVLSMTC